jgi:hypothetical protein
VRQKPNLHFVADCAAQHGGVRCSTTWCLFACHLYTHSVSVYRDSYFERMLPSSGSLYLQSYCSGVPKTKNSYNSCSSVDVKYYNLNYCVPENAIHVSRRSMVRSHKRRYREAVASASCAGGLGSKTVSENRPFLPMFSVVFLSSPRAVSQIRSRPLPCISCQFIIH